MNAEKKINPYAQAILNCLKPLSDKSGKVKEIDEKSTQFLTNMVQGRLIQYLVARISSHYNIVDSELQKTLMMTMMNIFRARFFGIFRENIRENPKIVLKIARQIIRNEIYCGRGECKRSDSLYLWIFRKYFEYKQVDGVLQIVEYNPEVRKVILISKLKSDLKDSATFHSMRFILQQDKEGVLVRLFNRYLRKNKIDRLVDLVASGDWRIEANFVYMELQKNPQCLIQ